jgi:hypothetical protein
VQQKGLTGEDFGTLDEAKEMARPIRSAHTRQEATTILNEIAKNGLLMSKIYSLEAIDAVL